ncbi:amino acid ABC transporter permease [Meiothermus ruber]|jgi:polar amino acid transport system permease protein|uniref:Polar amino acid ABC transporter permease n=1 Tax=Meiothermus ruber (strain ATCC 35948 / DSM 1279 / VKM B-1258 / 21) TaxID=504728 RepID=D3PQS6_MEIRD|nr:amino acid ABC transporter permease [Meiothermus ruber]ADD27809.1 polar amino acid ABC transporter, inner membrane subunit [Meiothermus ruber DSM 1279]AGK04276.1 polar amino acid ABC transporter permease [Meiothermus ruber DSM 1279]MCL6529967.1 amino acid ABC transporter permease [Meiothermus ruber]GAO74739.1 polar amino acid ABC transporter permease [Meiothermus ruber H328]
MDFGLIRESLPFLLQGAWVTLRITALSLVFGILLGTLVALARMSPLRWLSGLTLGYIELLRGTPLLVQIFLIFFGIPQLTQQQINEFAAGVIAFSINSSAYVAEILRAGIQSIPKGQREAALSLGFSPTQTLRYIILPQAFTRVIPPLVNEGITLLKNSSLLSAIAVVELTRAGQLISARTFKPFEMYLAVSLIYLTMTLVLSFVARRLERRWQVR